MKLVLRLGSAIVIGSIASVVAHAVAFVCFAAEYFQNYHPDHQWLPAIFFAPGRMFSGGDSGTRLLLCNVLAFAFVFAIGSFLLFRARPQLMLRLATAILIGVILSAALHLLALEYMWKFHAYGSFQTVFLALGGLLAPRGFESQAVLGLPFNVLAVAILFTTGAFLLLTQRDRHRGL
jgi:hypothetical protein